MSLKLVVLAITLMVSSTAAEAKSIYEQKQQVCSAIMQKIDSSLSKITDRDRIKDNKFMAKANLWAISYQQHECEPETYLNSLRRHLK